MSRELDEIAREFQKISAEIFRSEISLFQTNIISASTYFLKSIEQHCKKHKTGNIILLAIAPNPPKKMAK